MTPSEPDASPHHPSPPDPAVLDALLRRQGSLGVRIAVVFLLLVLGLPLYNHFTHAGGEPMILDFPISWFILGLLVYPITWWLSAVFVNQSERAEAEDAAELRAHGLGGPRP